MSDHDAPISNFETNAGTFRRSGQHGAGRPPRPEMARRVMDIEDVLIWAFQSELPKGYRSGGGLDNVGYPSMSPMFSMVATGGRVDNWSREPGFPAVMGDPHPDAILVSEAVQRLEKFAAQDIEDGLDLVPDYAAFAIDERAAMRKALPRAVAIVVRAAKRGRKPEWTQTTGFSSLRYDNGLPIVMAWQTLQSPKRDDMEGASAAYEKLIPVKALRNGTYPEGAHCVLTFDPHPTEIAEERAEYAVWWAALETLAQELTGKLKSIAVLPASAAQRPWINQDDSVKPPRLFADLTSRVYQRQQRETAVAHRQLGQRRPVGARNAAAGRYAPRRAAAAETMAC